MPASAASSMRTVMIACFKGPISTFAERVIRNAFVPVLLCLVLPVPSMAQRLATVSGRVLDAETGESLPYANVVVQETGQGSASNVDGYFALVGLAEGEYVLRVTYLGFQSAEIKVNTQSLAAPLEIRLAREAAYLEEVLVTAEQLRMMNTSEGVSQVVIAPVETEVLPNVGDADVFRALQLLPGISGTNEGSSGLYVRGGTPDQNLVLLDGMTVYHVDHLFGFFSAFNSDAIKDVRLYKGGYPAAYGGRASGVVDLTGRTGRNDLGASIGVNLLSASAVLEAPLGQQGSVLITGRRSYTDVLRTATYNNIYDMLTGADPGVSQGPQGPGNGSVGPGNRQRGALGAVQRGSGQATVQPDFYFYDLNAKLSYRPTSKDVLALSLYAGQDNLDESRFSANEITQGSQIGGRLVNDVYDVTDWGNFGASAKWSRQWTPRLYSNALVASSRYRSENTRANLAERYAAEADTAIFSRQGGTLENNRLRDITVRLDNEWHLSRAHKVDFGFAATLTDVRYENVRNDTLTILDEEQNARHVAAYMQDTWKPLPAFSLTAGIRTAWNDLTGDMYLEPRFAIQYDATDMMRLKGAYGRYNQFVARVVNEAVTEGARDFWLLANGKNVGIQQATHYVLGGSLEAHSWLLDVEAYYKSLHGLSEFSLRFSREGAGFEADDLFFDGGGVARGLEVLLQRKSGRHTGWLSYTFARIEHRFQGLNDGEPFPALHDQPHELKTVGSARLGSRWDLSATWAFSTGRPYTAPESQYTLALLDGTSQSYIHVGEKNGERLPAYHRLDGAIHYRFPWGSANVDVGFSVFNIYNRINVWYKEFDLTESPFVTTDVAFLGVTPNLSLRVDL